MGAHFVGWRIVSSMLFIDGHVNPQSVLLLLLAAAGST
ncbi:hypothetical protein GPLA_3758 [Paraglaciecola polaris LMG 21857]|uniref:Uncharacterized protein n=1 Tax=Paraglaciecola polaris LMG 21857 TaxID=1129793 RepID=K7A109_9ALTE|nr:hypothetical protein GPLA_3758 [Paraglaciecola polaris LMG 21857]